MKALALALLLGLAALGAARADDDALAQRGRALYHGQVAWSRGEAVTPLRLPVEMSACARCHGALGEGTREGGQPVPALGAAALLRERAGLPPLAGDAAVLRAITEGVGRGGAARSAAMPRYALQPDEARALLAYLRRLGTALDRPPGVAEDRIVLGSVLPLSGPGAATGEAIAAGLRAGLAEANARGGVHGRRIELQVQDARAGVPAALAHWRAEPVYALVGGLWNERAEDAEPLLAAAHLSHVAALVVREQAPRRADWSADLLAPLALQRAALVQALQRCDAGARVAMAHGDPEPAPTDIRWLAPSAAEAQSLQSMAGGCIGYTLAAAPIVQAAALPPGWHRTLVLPMPAELLEGAPGDRRATPWYRLGLAAARLGTELLSRAGRRLHERALLDQLDRVSELELSPGLVVQFGRQRRHAWAPLIVPLEAGAPAAAAQQPS